MYKGKISVKNIEFTLLSLFFMGGLFPALFLSITLPKVFYKPEFLLILFNIFLLAAIGFYIYLLIFLSEAEIDENHLIFKKAFRKKKSFTFDKIEEAPSSFCLKRTKFITVKMINEDGRTEKFVLLNKYPLSSKEDVDTEDILWEIM
ncbi:MAG: hypothetical protein FWD60_10225 [Candidatus Azobacteroides sp.]|nr:hypothetical protein [Candidatus Azobacteroides sp.]